MVTYFELQQKAQALPKALSYRVNCTNTFGCFFTLPSVFSDASMNHAQLIHLCAKELEEYSQPEDTKCKVLIGIYLVVWSYHNHLMTEWWGSNLVFLLQNHLKVDSPVHLERGLICESLNALSEFCSWVYEERDSKPEKMHLYTCLPVAIQVDIYRLKTEPWSIPALNSEFVETTKTYWGF